MSVDSTSEEKSIVGKIQNLALCDLLAEKEAIISKLEIEKRSLELQLARVPEAIRDVINEPSLRTKFEASRISEAVKTLTLVQRRDSWLSLLEKLGINGQLFGMFPHNGNDIDPVCILIYGSGGFGDMLYLSSILPAFFSRFVSPRIVVVHENPAVNVIFSNNPYVFSCVHLHGEKLSEFLDLSSSIDIFDLIAEVRYAISYIAPPLSRVPRDFLRVANSRSLDYQKYVRYSWPYLNNSFANEVVKSGMSKLDVLGYSGYLPVDSKTQLNYFPRFSMTQENYSALSDKCYVTVHHGSDKNMSNFGGLQTKNLPISTWADIVSILKDSGIYTVQLGDANEELIDGVDLDLRGATSFDETACLMKFASVHLDTEGGLVHVARAMNTLAVVMFGPTPLKFFGYSQNINLGSKSCENCWWTTKTWAIKCPSGYKQPACMMEHSSKEISSTVLSALSTDMRRFILESSIKYDENLINKKRIFEIALDEYKSSIGNMVRLVYLAIDDGLYSEWLSTAAQKSMWGPYDVVVVSAKNFLRTQKALSGIVEVIPSNGGNLPLDTGCFDFCIAIFDNFNLIEDYGIIGDLARCTKSEGRFQVTINSFLGELRKFTTLKYPGNKFAFLPSIDLCVFDGDALKKITVTLFGKIVNCDLSLPKVAKGGPFNILNKFIR
ncbi:glycosyltransferase family 9 protein [Quatrionicoccus australiensis]|uniref:glycosyltransferase family 9 protein n=1 Tax=Quatrionicoccus australiensis TaxID=138118 RepID=UPI001CF83D63|nr:glycosyltransferase family 9 protein [Quatrionicoccus australiensis]UCV13410.1 glycosyltransferase family 9 protein [Quatrionicoccus australiensis]